jgi:transcriptional regulator with XRE-family HTH domain
MTANANDTPQIGRDLRQARRAAGLTQQQVAMLAACSMSYVRLLEGGFMPAHASDVLPRVMTVLTTSSPAGGPSSTEIDANSGGDGAGSAY